MRKKTIAAILSAVSALTCLSPLSADALGEVDSESLESAVSELYGTEYREWGIYALDEFDGKRVKVFQAVDNWRSKLAAIYDGTEIYIDTDLVKKVEEYMTKNYPAYKEDHDYTSPINGYNIRFNSSDFNMTDIRNICNDLKEQGLIYGFDYKIGSYNLRELSIEPYLTGYEAYSSKGRVEELVKTLTEFVNKHNLDFSVVVFNTEEKKIMEYDNEDVLPFEYTAYVDADRKYPCYFEFPVVCLIPNEGVSDYEHSKVAILVKEELGLWNNYIGWTQVIGGRSISASEKQHIDVFNAVPGDSNNDKSVTISDAVMILQNLANSEKYPFTPQGEFNADIYNTGDGVTGLDAAEIQKLDAEGKLNQ